jgi:general secretion pathway protein F
MAEFSYRAIDARGQFVSGELQAASMSVAVNQLVELGYIPLSTSPAVHTRRGLWAFLLSTGKVPARDVTVLLQDLVLLLRSGLPLDEGLRLLTENASGATNRLITRLRASISNGANFAEALQSHPATNLPELVAVVRSAEAAGILVMALEQFAQERVKQDQIRSRIQSAIRYPLFLLVVSMGVLLFFLLFVVPQFADVVRDFGTKPDPMVGAVIRLSTTLRDNVDVVSALAVGFVVLVFLAWRFEPVRKKARVLLRLPLIRSIVTLRRTAMFCRSLGMLLSNGVNLTDALRLMSESGVGDDRIAVVFDRVRRGGRLVDALAETNLIQQLATRMLRVGEESGALASVSIRCAGYYEAKLTEQIDKLTGIVGPAAIVFISSVIGTLIVSVMSTLLSINQMIM